MGFFKKVLIASLTLYIENAPSPLSYAPDKVNDMSVLCKTSHLKYTPLELTDHGLGDGHPRPELVE